MAMHAQILDGPEAEADASLRCLSDIEQAVLRALDGEFVSATVVRWRAKLPTTQRVGPTLAACTKLEQLGLAECIGVGLARRWARAGSGDFVSA
ncbi:hypothetical protein [Methylobacterium dankookense]|uniref:Uncharacterized protein n=1 Tax=Methylobacterium dankookense TaxID=560405 RepID=A0A564FYC3_9HYPH|nr:hypothetical protein [Methylobacterium dankookense]GJD54297.1 hypothetical protein IFDJLNFL_0167 [Methylobacterium dankookense]VUF12992.1 hypothetical protein MTDSW087_02689 [Methylobacterium dankookense]